ncbi:amidase [Microbacterium sp. E-13]|uniref:amidase n=1 Tax=Microbacterium sp. E-13 TaxID=3404048 RepID=UPI003CF61C2D
MTNELAWLDGHEIAALIRTREIKPSEAVAAALAQVSNHESQVNAFVTVLFEEAMSAAEQADKRLMEIGAHELPPLFGVPLTVKDLAPTAGVRTTFGSTAFADHVPSEDSISVGRLRGAGAILIGKTTTPEFGMLGVTESALTGITNNPWRLGFTTGGSSGGAAAAVAAGMAPLAWGSDGGGSIRIPASYCGVVGLKPSMRWIPGDQPWDTAVTDGPLSRTVAGIALMLEVTAGFDPRSPHSTPIARKDFVAATLAASPDLSGVRIAVAMTPSDGPVAAEVRAVVGAAVARLAEAGAVVSEVRLDLPDPVEYFIDFWGPFFLAEDAPLPHPAMREVREAAGRVTLASYLHASTVTRGEITRVYNDVFRDHDFLITPTSPVAPFVHPGALGGATHVDETEVRYPAIDFHRLTESASHAGIPAITVPAGSNSEGLPIGMQLHAPQHQDIELLRLARAWEQIAPWRQILPEFLR